MQKTQGSAPQFKNSALLFLPYETRSSASEMCLVHSSVVDWVHSVIAPEMGWIRPPLARVHLRSLMSTKAFPLRLLFPVWYPDITRLLASMPSLSPISPIREKTSIPNSIQTWILETEMNPAEPSKDLVGFICAYLFRPVHRRWVLFCWHFNLNYLMLDMNNMSWIFSPFL